MIKAVSFGEILWDVFPDSKKIGGAPLNVALRLQSFGIDTAIISKVGNDDNGKALVDYIEKNNVSTGFIQIDKILKTGEVTVFLDENGSATYDIKYPVAWDKIQFTSALEQLISDADAFIYGSLVCRDSTSKNTLISLLKLSKFSIFDVNLRSPHYTKETILELMQASDFIKFNDEEIIAVCNYFSLPTDSLETQIQSISEFTNTQQICVTRGNKGAVLFINNEYYYNGGIRVKVADTVGAGDSFLAGLVNKLLRNEHPQKALGFGCAIGALVASKSGANSIITESEIKNL